jgi:hypothetical protein
MTVIKQYNPVTSAWEKVLIGAPGPTGPAGGPTGATGHLVPLDRLAGQPELLVLRGQADPQEPPEPPEPPEQVLSM